MAGEFALLGPYLSWQRYGNGCVTSSHVALATGQTLDEQRRRAPNAPFLYRWGVEDRFAPDAVNLSHVQLDERIGRALAWLNATRVKPWIDWCDHHPSSVRSSMDHMWRTLRGTWLG
eukprot:7378343-Prymnesium_polylepis.1